DKVTHGKPDPEIYLTAASLLGTDPKECIAFEDSRNGLRSAYRAGMYPIQIPDLVPPGVESDALSWKTFPSLVEAREFLCGWIEA
ncbi:MAG: HAD-IA family hydrolase, partial [Oscillospiraceae bacterium]|nr:HAD-IA family hydrolase [Oscillospiraceae bacterium]